LTWEYEEETDPEKKWQQQVEIIPIDANYAPIATGKHLSESTQKSWNIDITGAKRVRIKPWGGDLESYTLTYQSNSEERKEKLDSRYTIIESTGYFGNTKRKLQVKIDRHSGQLLGLYDFVLYSGEGSIEGP